MQNYWLKNKARQIFGKSSKHLLGIFQTLPRNLPDIFQTPSRHPVNTYQTHPRHLKETHQTLLRHCSDITKYQHVLLLWLFFLFFLFLWQSQLPLRRTQVEFGLHEVWKRITIHYVCLSQFPYICSFGGDGRTLRNHIVIFWFLGIP